MRALRQLFNRSNGSEDRTGLVRLTKLVRRFSVEQQQVPKDLSELVKLQYLTRLPVAPKGAKFVIDRRKVEVLLLPLAGEHPGARPLERRPKARAN